MSFLKELFQDDSPNKVSGASSDPTPAPASSSRRITPAIVVNRDYKSARQTRLNADWTAASTSADAEIRSSLTALRGRARALDRDSAYAKRAKRIVVNNVVGAGVGMQGNVRSVRNKTQVAINKAIEEAWREWFEDPRYCHTGGELAAGEFERAVMGEVFEAGEVFIRQHFDSFGGSRIPYALELIESERVPHGIQPEALSPTGNVRMGVEVDRYHRPGAYWVRDYHPSDFKYPSTSIATDQIRRIPAEQIIHLRLIERWPQTRGIPWLHAVAQKLNDMDGYSEAEIVAARGAANYMAAVETDPMAELGDEQEDGTRQVELSPGIVLNLNPGEKINFFNPSRPNTALDEFMRYMLREVAAGVNVSYESLSRDYSQSNYSSSRLSLLDDRDSWRVLQNWYLLKFRRVVHRNWLRQAVLSRAIENVRLDEYGINARKFEAVRFKPRGWGWIDPTKEVEAYRKAEAAGYKTKTAIIAETGSGQDFEDVLEERRAELDAIEAAGLEFDTDSPTKDDEPAPAPPSGEDDEQETDDDVADKNVRLVK